MKICRDNLNLIKIGRKFGPFTWRLN